MSSRPASFLRASLILAAVLGAFPGAGIAAQALYAGVSTSPPSSPSVAVDTGGPRWDDLAAPQKKVLAPLSNDWNGLDSRSKERWLDVAGRFHKLPPEEQTRANLRMAEWAHMTVAQRTQARLNFQESRSVSKEEREARWKAYQALPDDKKRELAKRAAAPASAAQAAANGPHRHATTPVYALQPKKNVVGGLTPGHAASDVALTTVPAHPGATTTLPNRRAVPPRHQPDGQPKIAAGPAFVDRTTLLPKRGPQATVSAAASTPPASHP